MSKIKDLTGQKFGMLTVLSIAGVDKHNKSRWNCICDCGNRKIVNAVNLKGKTRSCGCYRKSIIKNNLTGKRFGRLLVLEHVGSTSNGASLWRCMCDCGNEKILPNNSLVSGNTKSCGCYKWKRKVIK